MLDPQSFRNILVIRLSALGDVVNTLPLLPLLRAACPQARISYLTGPLTAPLIEADPCVDRVLVHRRSHGWLRRLRYGLALRGEGFDLLIDLSRARYSAMLARLSGVAVRLGRRPGRAFTHVSTAGESEPLAVHRMRAVLAPLGLGVAPVGPRFPDLDRSLGPARGLLESAGLQPDTTPVLLSPGHSAPWPTKAWPVAHWAALARALHARTGVPCVLVGGPGDRPQTSAIAAAAGAAVVDLAGRTDLPTLGGLAHLAPVVVSTDSGPMHLAAMAGSRVVALFGPTDPGRSRPLGEGHVSLHRGLDCSPCYRKACPYAHECLDQLEPEQVLAAVEGLLAGSAPPGCVGGGG